jgi:predicted MFS family arabinose efflux permease
MKILFRRELNLIWWANVGVMVCYTANGALLPLMMRARGIGEGWSGFALGMISAGSVLGYLTTGQAIDRLDRRWFILSGGLLWALTSWLAWLAVSVPALALVRLVQGFAYAILYTATLVYAARALPLNWRGRMIGLVEAIGALAIAATPGPVYALAQRWGYAPVLGLTGLVGLLTGLAALLLPRQDNGGGAQERPARGLFERKALAPGLVAVCLFSCATAFVTLSPLVALRMGIGAVGAFLGLRALGTVPARLLSGAVADRFGPGWAIIPGLALSILSFGLIPFARGEVVGLGLAFLFGCGMGLASPAISAWLLRGVPQERQGVALNTLYIFTEGAGFLGAWAFGLGLEKAGLALSQAGLCAVLALGIGLYLALNARGARASIRYSSNPESLKNT